MARSVGSCAWAAALALGSFRAMPPEPRVECARPAHDFGLVDEGARLVHEFELTASGRPAISSIRPTCGCVSVRVEVTQADGTRAPYELGAPLAPGAAVAVTAELDTANRREVASAKVIVASDDPRGALVLSIAARVRPHFVVAPDVLDFGELAEGANAERTFEVSARKPGTFALALETDLPAGVRVDPRPVDPDASGRASRWIVAVALGPGCRDGGLAYPLALASDEPIPGAARSADGRPATFRASALLKASIRGPISYDPAYLAFGLVERGTRAERVLAVRTDDPAFTFPQETRVRLAPAREGEGELPFATAFSHAVERSADGRSLTVRLSIDGLPDSARGPFQGRLVLATGHPRRPEITVTFAGVFR